MAVVIHNKPDTTGNIRQTRIRNTAPQPPADVIDALRGCAGIGHRLCDHATVQWRYLSGGRSNLAWRVTGQDISVVVKYFADTVRENPLFPNDPLSESAILRHLADTGLAPRLRELVPTPHGTCLIYDHINGSPWRGDPAPIARLLGRVHRHPPLPGLRRVANGAAAIINQGAAILALCPDSPHKKRLTALRPTRPDVAPTTDLRLLHGDPVIGNVIGAAGGPVLIDWQCPAIGDPCEDIAIALSPAMHLSYANTAPPADAAFLDAYGDPAIASRYLGLRPYYHWRMAAYCLWRYHRHNDEDLTGYARECDALTTCAGK